MSARASIFFGTTLTRPSQLSLFVASCATDAAAKSHRQAAQNIRLVSRMVFLRLLVPTRAPAVLSAFALPSSEIIRIDSDHDALFSFWSAHLPPEHGDRLYRVGKIFDRVAYIRKHAD